MSLEQAANEEAKLLADILERQKRQSTGARGRGRGGPGDRSEDRSHSRGLSHVRSSSTGGVQLVEVDDEFAITQHDPSERLVFTDDEEDNNNTNASHSRQNSTNTMDSFADSIVELRPDSILSGDDRLSSEEEQISDTDNEFVYDDGGSILPNYTTYSTLEKASGSSVPNVSMRAEEKRIQNKRIIENALKSEKLDSVIATERGLANAHVIGKDIPREVLNKVEKEASEVGRTIDITKEEDSITDEDRKEKLKGYSVYKKKLVSSQSGSAVEGFIIPYTSDVEEKIDSELAKILNEKVDISEIDSNVENARAIRTITRGNFFELLNGSKNPKSFVLCLDFSAASIYALEWCIGTILVDGSVLYILNVIEDDDYSSMNLNGIPSNKSHSASSPSPNSSNNISNKSQREQQRYKNVEKVTEHVLELIKMTKLQVHVVIESVHHPIPRHFIVEIIHHISPTLVIVGSKGNSAIQGVLLGSLSNYLIRKSSAPVMVVKNKLKKLPKKGKQFSNNIGTLHSLAEAKVD